MWPTAAIDCQGSAAAGHRGFLFRSEDANSVIDGLTITGGYVTGVGGVYGGAINCDDNQSIEATPTIQNCIIIGNTAKRGGGRCNCSGAIINCLITNNVASVWSGGGLRDCDGFIMNCVITDNYSAQYGGGPALCHADIVNCVIADNDSQDNGGGLYDCGRAITNCTITSNGNEGVYGCDGPITNCIVWGNDSGDVIASALPKYSCFGEGSIGVGNIVADPLFADPCAGDYHLQSQHGRYDPMLHLWVLDELTSLCIDGGIRWSIRWPSRCLMGPE